MAKPVNNYDWEKEDFFAEAEVKNYERAFSQLGPEAGIKNMRFIGGHGGNFMARMMMIADGYSLESTLMTDTEHAGVRHEYGQKAYTLLLECVEEVEKNKDREEKDNDYTKRNELYEYCNRAAEKSRTMVFPDIDYTNLDEVAKHKDSIHAWRNLDAGMQVAMYSEHTNWRQRTNSGAKEMNTSSRQLSMLSGAMDQRAKELGNPPELKSVKSALENDILLSFCGDAVKGKTPEQCSGLMMATIASANRKVRVFSFAAPYFDEPNKEDNLKRCADYLNGERDAVCPYYIDDGAVKVSPSYDPAFGHNPVHVNLRESQSEYEAGNYEAIFDKMLAGEPDVPDAHSEVPEKRIYIDGKNAYDEFSKKHPEIQNEVERSRAVKADIVKALTEGKKRVEFVRMERSHDGLPVATVVPVQADLTMLDEKKSWYQTSFAKRADALWEKDRNQEERQRAIKEQAERKQGEHLMEALRPVKSVYYTGLLEIKEHELNVARENMKGHMFENISEDMEKNRFDAIAKNLNRDPKETAEWIKLKEEKYSGLEKNPPVQLEQEKQRRLQDLDGKILGMQLSEGAKLEEEMAYHKLEADYMEVREVFARVDRTVLLQSMSNFSDVAMPDVSQPEKMREYLRAGKELAATYGVTDEDIHDYLRNGASKEEREKLSPKLAWRDRTLKQGDYAPIEEAYQKEGGHFDICPELLDVGTLYFNAMQYKTYKEDFRAVDPGVSPYQRYLERHGNELRQKVANEATAQNPEATATAQNPETTAAAQNPETTAAAQHPGKQVPFADFVQKTAAAEPKVEIPVAGVQNSMSTPANSQEMKH